MNDYVVIVIGLCAQRAPFENAAEAYARMLGGDAQFRVVLTM